MEENNMSKTKWIKTLVKKDMKQLIIIAVMGIAVSSLGLSVAIFTQKFIDDILPQGNVSILIGALAILTGILLFKQAINYIKQRIGLAQNRAFNLRLISEFFESLLKLPLNFFTNHSAGDMIARMNDTVSIQQTIAYVVNVLVLNVLVLCVSATVLFYYSIKVGLIALCALPVFTVVSFLFKKRIITAHIELMESNAKKESNYITTLQNIQLIKGSNNEKRFSAINEQVFGFYQNKILKLGKVNISVQNLAELVGSLFFIILIAVISFMTFNQEITIGEFAAILEISTSMLPPAGILAFSHLQLLGAKVVFDRMYEFASLDKEYDMDADLKKERPGEINNLSIQNVSFAYEGDKIVLNNISLNANKGEIVCIYGENGTGKSTLINLIQGFYTPVKGGIYFNDKPIHEMSIYHLRQEMALVAQQTRLFNKSIIENICLEREESIDKAIIALNKLGFDKYFSRLPDGYHTIVQEDGSNLSGGQLQLVSFARAIYQNPQILLLDEPSASLDTEVENFIMDIILEFKKHALIILVTHKLRPAKLSDRIYIIKDGMINSSGNHSQLLETPNLYSNSFIELMN